MGTYSKGIQNWKFHDQKWSSVLLAIVGIASLELESAAPPGMGDLFAFLHRVWVQSIVENVAKKYSTEQGPGIAACDPRHRRPLPCLGRR